MQPKFSGPSARFSRSRTLAPSTHEFAIVWKSRVWDVDGDLKPLLRFVPGSTTAASRKGAMAKDETTRQPGAPPEEKIGVCSLPKNSPPSNRCVPEPVTPAPAVPTPSHLVTWCNSAPALTTTGKRRYFSSAQLGRMAASAGRFCARTVAARERHGTRTGHSKSPGSAAPPSPSPRLMFGLGDTRNPAPCATMYGASRCKGNESVLRAAALQAPIIMSTRRVAGRHNNAISHRSRSP